MIQQSENWERSLAKDFALNTNRNIFLTGKAGTGKTTLLKEILKETEKNYIVAAPTGVAAINAGGITLHSLFFLPLKTFIPVVDSGHNIDLFCDPRQLVKNQKFKRAKIDILLELELLIIDEISMVRADTLDAIDHTLRRVRRNQNPFGGVQVLVIGDLFQLAPVVRSNVEHVLQQYYKSPFFFDSRVWSNTEAITIELKKVYRQEEQEFVDMLNSIREGTKDEGIIEKLNTHYSDTPTYSNTITLTTHNKKADEINQTEINKIDQKAVNLSAKVTGRFPENAFPTSEQITLKKGAQVMFIRNHPDGLYYNGKIGIITEIKTGHIKVKEENGHSIMVEPVDWKNLQFNLDEKSGKIIEEEIGSFNQYPLRLAWAVTVHKSQGLSFDKVILDLEGSFASGQLYVALSRCRSLAGLTLSSKIKAQNIITNNGVLNFTKENQLDNSIKEILSQEKIIYENHQLIKFLELDKLLANLSSWREIIINGDITGSADALLLNRDIESVALKLLQVSKTYITKLKGYLTNPNIEESFITERTNKAIGYFSDQIFNNIVIPMIKHGKELSTKKGNKAYLNSLELVIKSIWKIVQKQYVLKFRNKTIFDGEIKKLPLKTEANSKPKPKPKQVKGATQQITKNMLEEGKTIALIAKERGLALSTIESHIGTLIRQGKISIHDVMDEKKLEKCMKYALANPDNSLTELIVKIPFKISFGELRWVVHHRDYIDENK